MRKNRQQRIAISQAEIGKRCKPYLPICQGNRAFRSGVPREDNPYSDRDSLAAHDREVWFQGWDIAHDDKRREGEND